MRLRYLAPALGALLALAAAACGGGATPSPSAVGGEVAAPSPVTVTDSNGKQVTFASPPERIVALAPSFVEVLFAIGAGGAVVAVDDNTDFPPEAAALTKLSGFQPSVEGIAALEPDLVVIFFDPGGLGEALERLGIPVLFLMTPASIQGVYDQITLLGEATGHLQEAQDLVAGMKVEVQDILSRLEDVTDGPRVFHEFDNQYFTASDDDFVGDLYLKLNAQNIAAGAGLFPQLSAEAIIDADPEVIVLADEDAGESPDTVKARPGWDGISAVRNGRVHVVDPDIVSRPGPRLVEALRTLAAYLYPERFP